MAFQKKVFDEIIFRVSSTQVNYQLNLIGDVKIAFKNYYSGGVLETDSRVDGENYLIDLKSNESFLATLSINITSKELKDSPRFNKAYQ